MRANSEIKVNTCRLIFPDGQNKIVTIQEAKQYAEEYNLDLVEVSMTNGKNLSVCKILDYGKMQYEQKKKEKKNKHNPNHVLKEMRLKYKTDIHDVIRKNNKVKDFILKKYRVNYCLELKHRDRLFLEEAKIKFEKYLLDFTDVAIWSQPNVSKSDNTTRIFTTISPK